jgi:cupin 2 domain-containing protein
MNRGNIFENMPEKLTQEEIRTVARAPGTRIERIVSTGQASPPGFWYDQDLDEWVVVLKGRARLEFENQEDLVEMSAGDWISIPAHERHRVAWTAPNEPTIWLAVHYSD